MPWISFASLVVAMVSVLFVILNFGYDRKGDSVEAREQALKREREIYERELERIKKDTENTATIKTKLEELCSQNNSIKDDVRETNRFIQEMAKNQTAHNEQMKTIFNKLDDHEERIKELEKHHNG